MSDLTRKLEHYSELQLGKTSCFYKKVLEFLKIRLCGYENTFERFVLDNEPNDCSLIAKYAQVTTINLSSQPSISIDELSLSSLHIPHPLINFMRNESNQALPDTLDVNKELSETPILLFIHGLGGQMSQFEPLMGLLSQCLEVFSLDLPGFGNSKVDPFIKMKTITKFTEEERNTISSGVSKMTQEDFTTELIVNIIYEFIQQNIPEEKKIVLIGHSMGTHLSIKVAKKLPEHKVEGMVLLSPPPLVDDVSDSQTSSTSHGSTMLKFFNYFPWIFNSFRIWDRLQGLDSKSVSRQLSLLKVEKPHTKLRQLRWNIDINSNIILKYVHGFKKASYSDLITAISKFNNNPFDTKTYEKVLLIGGKDDQITSVKNILDIHNFLNTFFKKQVSSTIEIHDAGHSLLLNKPELVSGMVLNHIELKFPERLRLSAAWVLKVKAEISGDKWGLKNELKWLKLKPVSDNITRNKFGIEVAPLLGMKTLRQDDDIHSPSCLENTFYGEIKKTEKTPAGKLIAIIDISADIPPYNPKSFKHIKYYKCATVSKVVPDQVAVRRFIDLVDDILLETDVENPLIAVHCHYGFNRTGFLICCYLVERLGWSVAEAVEGFKRAKEPGIKHPHFIDALYVKYEG